jgi:hypothetical protein
MRRRSFLAWLTACASVIAAKLAAVRAWPGRALASAPPATPAATDALLFFTAEQGVTMEALLERLRPSSVPPGTPGARETRVLRYFDAQLGTARFPQYREVIRAGLAGLDEIAHAKLSVRFHELSADGQDEILRGVQRGDAQGRSFEAGRFFQVVLTLALEGHWGSPRYGGNHEALAWRSVGIDPGCVGGMRACR